MNTCGGQTGEEIWSGSDHSEKECLYSDTLQLLAGIWSGLVSSGLVGHGLDSCKKVKRPLPLCQMGARCQNLGEQLSHNLRDAVASKNI